VREGYLSENPQSFRAVASGQSGIVIFVIHCYGSFDLGEEGLMS